MKNLKTISIVLLGLLFASVVTYVAIQPYLHSPTQIASTLTQPVQKDGSHLNMELYNSLKMLKESEKAEGKTEVIVDQPLVPPKKVTITPTIPFDKMKAKDLMKNKNILLIDKKKDLTEWGERGSKEFKDWRIIINPNFKSSSKNWTVEAKLVYVGTNPVEELLVQIGDEVIQTETSLQPKESIHILKKMPIPKDNKLSLNLVWKEDSKIAEGQVYFKVKP